MSVISLSITESSEQIVSGIPKTISISANTPSTIFYTLDGSVPTNMSNVYVGTITLPTLPSPRLRVWATNGIDSSAVIEKDYGPDISSARIGHPTVVGLDLNVKNALGLYGSNSQQVENAEYRNASFSGITVISPSSPSLPSGRYDSDGYQAANTAQPLINYHIIQTESNPGGVKGFGIGTLIPVNKEPVLDNDHPEESNLAQKLFNPKAMVIFQDSETEDLSSPPMLNRESFSLQPSSDLDGTRLFNDDMNIGTATGSFIKSFYNPRENTITYYYRDSITNRWIISKQPYQVRDPNVGNLSTMVFGRQSGNGFVFKWIPFQRRVLS